MRLSLILLPLLLLIAPCAWGQPNAGALPETALLRHEKWVFMYAVSNRNMAQIAKSEAPAPAAIEIAVADELVPSQGLELFFYRDGSFKIKDWYYGQSSDLFQSFYIGTYHETANPHHLELIFDTEQRPIAPFFMHVLRDSRIDTLANPLARCKLQIMQDLDDNWLKVNIVAYDDESLTYIIGQAMFTREELAEGMLRSSCFTAHKVSARHNRF